MVLILDGQNLTAAEVVAVARQRQGDGSWPEVKFAEEARVRLAKTRAYIE